MISRADMRELTWIDMDIMNVRGLTCDKDSCGDAKLPV